MQPFSLFLVLFCLVLFGSERGSSEVALAGRGSVFFLCSLWLSSIFNRPAHRYDPAMEFIQSSLILSIQPSPAQSSPCTSLRDCVPACLTVCFASPDARVRISSSIFRKRANQSSHGLLPESIHHFLTLTFRSFRTSPGKSA
jgi:hypothetical protein